MSGKPQSETYREFQKEMDLFNRAFLEVMYEGDANGRVFTLPIPTYNLTKDFDWENPHLDFLWKVTARYGVPYFSNFVNSDLDPEDARSMCCRLRLDNRELPRFSFTTAEDYGEGPVVVSTNPPDGATDVSWDLAAVSITFSKAMDTTYMSIGSNFGPYTSTWSADKRTIILTRQDTASPLSTGMTYYFVLNGVGYEQFSGY